MAYRRLRKAVQGSEITVLENSEISIGVAPEFGARVVTLRNLRTGRDWMAAGDRACDAAEDAVYGAAQAAGWDECFPTVSPSEEVDPAWNRRLRDHGDLWGRPWRVHLHGNRIEATFSGESISFRRIITLDRGIVDVAYSVRNRGNRPLPYLWAQHGVLAVEPQDRITIAGLDGPLAVTFCQHRGLPLKVGQTTWPHASGMLGDLRTLRTREARLAVKMYGAVRDRFRAAVGRPDDYLCFEWSQRDAPFVGLWLNFGGWPSEMPAYHIAIEPTSAPADHLAGARALFRERVLEPGALHAWKVRLSLGPAHEK